jgi:hypothetical protein
MNAIVNPVVLLVNSLTEEEEKLLEKLRRIKALFARPGTEGEKGAALNAMERIKARLREFEKIDPPIEYKFSLPDIWLHRVMMALLQRYGAKPYRYSGQRRTTIMAKISRRFVHEALMPEALHLLAGKKCPDCAALRNA